MNDRIGFEDPRLQRMEQATRWLQRMRTAGPDDRIVEAWLDWCQRDPLNQQAFDEIAAVWEISGQLRPEPARAVAPHAGLSRRALVASFAGVGLAGIAGTWWWMQPRDAVQTSEFASPIGINSIEMLADGSVLELGGGTRVTVSISPRERRVELHAGELFVKVRHDTTRPFLVVSGWLEAVATGTAFNVLRTPQRTTVTVTEGSVATFHEGRSAGTNVTLQAGQRLIYSHATHGAEVRQTDTEHATAWRSGTLYFQGEPVSEVVESINRYTARSIVVEEPWIRDFSFTGTSHTTDEGSDGWLKALIPVLDFRVGVTQLTDGRRMIVARSVAPD